MSKACAVCSKGALSSPPGAMLSPSSAACHTATSQRPSRPPARSASRASSAPTAIDAATSSWRCSSAASSIRSRSWPRHGPLPATASTSLGEALGLGAVDENQLYAALDWLLVRQPAIEAILANAMYEWQRRRSTTCRRATSRADAVRWPSVATAVMAAEAIADRLRAALRRRRMPGRNRGIRRQHRRSETLTPQIEKLKQRFHLDQVVLVGDRGMITEARITEDLKRPVWTGSPRCALRRSRNC